MKLSNEALQTIDATMSPLGGMGKIGKITEIDSPRLVNDATSKFLVTDKRNRPSAFVLLSPSSFPNAVADAAKKTADARSVLSFDTGQRVLVPLHVGVSNGASYSITEYGSRLSTNRLTRLWSRYWLRQDLSRWLLAVCRETVVVPTSLEVENGFITPLRAVVDHPLLCKRLKEIAETAQAEIATGEWKPRHILAHNDLWEGNVLLPSPHGQSSKLSFVLIDWGASSPNGYGIFDLVRMALSFRMPYRQVRREIALHCEALSCAPHQARYHVAAALGSLALNLGLMPEVRFSSMTTTLTSILDECTP